MNSLNLQTFLKRLAYKSETKLFFLFNLFPDMNISSLKS